MNHYDAIQIRQRHARGQPVGEAELAEANAYIERNRSRPTGQDAREQMPPAAPVRFFPNIAPTFDTLCTCGLRYGMHRVGDFSCPNQQWRPGNGQPQWLTRKWVRG